MSIDLSEDLVFWDYATTDGDLAEVTVFAFYLRSRVHENIFCDGCLGWCYLFIGVNIGNVFFLRILQ